MYPQAPFPIENKSSISSDYFFESVIKSTDASMNTFPTKFQHYISMMPTLHNASSSTLPLFQLGSKSCMLMGPTFQAQAAR